MQKPFAIRLIEALKNGEAFYKETKGKHTYIYKLRNKPHLIKEGA